MRRTGERGRAGGGRRAPAARARTATAAADTAAAERLQKVLARAGFASRREAEAWIRAGRLTINGTPAALGAKVTPQDSVRLDGRLVRAREVTDAHAYVCHRSPGEPLTAGTSTGATAQQPRTGLLQRLPRRAGRRFIAVSPMPRVDGGLELVTSDGELAVRLQRAAHTLASVFGVRVRGELNPTQHQGILGGVLDSGAQLEVHSLAGAGGEGLNRWYTLSARGASGKQVRQLFERQGALVSRVMRTHFGPVTLERSLGRGRFRELTQAELGALLAL
jgi:23S rRNA pseudouridine2605 synthase